MNNLHSELNFSDRQIASGLGSGPLSSRDGKPEHEAFPDAATVVNQVTRPGNRTSQGSEPPEMIRPKPGRNIVLFGPPGVGKGVQAKVLINEEKLGYLSTGDAIREEIRRRTPVGRRLEELTARGCFADDETVLGIVASRLDRPEFRFGFLMDGFPRTVRQAEMFDRMLAERGRRVDVALFLRAPEETILARLSGRLICSRCGASYHSAFRRPRVDDVCDSCGGAVARRKDDDPEVHRRRLEIYVKETAPLEDYYRRQGVLAQVDGDRPVAEVAVRIRRAVRLRC